MTFYRLKLAVDIEDPIRQILYHDWDPLGGVPQDEYDSYIEAVYRILISSRSESDLVGLLYRIETEVMQIEPENTGTQYEAEERLRPVARKLLSLDMKQQDRQGRIPKIQ